MKTCDASHVTGPEAPNPAIKCPEIKTPATQDSKEKSAGIIQRAWRKFKSLSPEIIRYTVEWNLSKPQMVQIRIIRGDMSLSPSEYLYCRGSSRGSSSTTNIPEMFDGLASLSDDEHLRTFIGILKHCYNTGDLNLFELFKLVSGHPLTSHFLNLPEDVGTDFVKFVTKPKKAGIQDMANSVANKLDEAATFIETLRKRIKSISYWTLLKIMTGRMKPEEILRAIADMLREPKASLGAKAVSTETTEAKITQTS